MPPPLPAEAEPGPLDEEALVALYARMEKPLLNVVYRWLWDEVEARDVAQEAFLRLWRMRERVVAGTAEPLVYRMALNLAANRRRTRRLWGWLGLDSAGERRSAERPADEQLSRAEQERAVREAIDALPEKLRRVVVMTELSELGYAEVAQALGIPEGTVASRRHAAIKQLEARLGAQVEVAP